MKAKLLVGALTLLALPSFAVEKWNLDDTHASVKFGVRHLMISEVDGRFKKFSANVETDGADLKKVKAEASIDVASIDTDNSKRDEHLRSADFFDAAKWPKITFKSKRVAEVNGNRMKLVGDLTIRDKTKEVTLDAELTPSIKDPWGNTRRGFTATGRINREEWGMTWNKAIEAGGVAVGKEVDLRINLELQQAKSDKKG